MTRIIASAQQRKCRNLFKEAVDYANKVYADPARKKEWTNKSRKKHRVFNYIIKEYMLAAKEAAQKRQDIGTIIIRKCFPLGSGRLQTVRPLSKNGPVIKNLKHKYVETG